VLATFARDSESSFGVYGDVLVPGRITRDDWLRVLD
jgi:hypothetical protein